MAKSDAPLPPVLPNLKIALVGDPGVGKTSVVLRYLKNQFSPLYIPTKKVAVETVVRKLNVPANTVVSLILWDIPGREDMDIHESYFRNLDAAIVVVDLTSKSSIEMANVWKQTVLNRLTRQVPADGNNNNGETKDVPVSSKNFPVLLLGNKFDVIQEEIESDFLNKQVSASMNMDGQFEFQHEAISLLESVAEEHGFIGSVTVSARKADSSVTVAIQSLVRNILEKRDVPRKWKPVPPKPKPPKKDRPFIYDKLDKTDIEKVFKMYQYNKLELLDSEQFDPLIEKADAMLKQTVMLRHYHTVALSRFKHACWKGGLLTDEEPSLEDCVQAMKTNTKQGVLKIVEDEEFLKLDVRFENDVEVKQTKPWKNAYKIFHTEYASICKKILQDGPKLCTGLEKYGSALDKLMKAEDFASKVHSNDPGKVKDSKGEVDQEKTHKVLRNTAKILNAQEEMKLTIEQVESESRKISNVDHW